MNRISRLVILPLVVYAAAAIWMTYPLIAQFSTHVGGGGFGDSFEYVRLGWWGQFALKNGLNPFVQSLLAYPDGFFSATQIAQPLIYWPISVLALLIGPVSAFNLWLLLEVILSGLTAYWLCLTLIGKGSVRTLPALVGGLIFMAFPAVQGQLSSGHINPLANYALPILVLCLFRITTQPPRLRDALIGALAILILALGNFTFLVYMLLPLLLFGGLYFLLTDGARIRQWPVIRGLAVLLGGGALLILPFYWPLIRESLASDRPAYLQETGQIRYSTDPLAFVAPSPFSSWSQAAPAYSREVLGTNSTEGSAYLGIVALGLAAVGNVARRKTFAHPRLWLVIGLGCMLFSLGPILKWRDQPVIYTVGDYQSSIVLPWALFQNLPLVNVTRTPGRFNITTGLMLGILAALGTSALLKRVRIRPGQIALSAACMTLILLDYQLFTPFPTIPAAVPAYFEALASRADVRAVLDVPVIEAQKDAMYLQTVHHKPLIAGYVSRRTTVDPAKLSILSDMAQGRAFALTADGLQAPTADVVRGVLRQNGIDVLVYHWAFADNAAILPIAMPYFSAPVYQDDGLAVFEVRETPTNMPLPLVATLVDSSRLDPIPLWRDGLGWRWLNRSTDIYLYAPNALDLAFNLDLRAVLQPRTLQLAVDGAVQRAWNVGPSDSGTVFWLRLAAGFHSLRLTTPEDCITTPIPPARLLENSPCAQNPAGCTLPQGKTSLCVTLALGGLRVTSAGDMQTQDQRVGLGEGFAMTAFRAPKTAKRGSTLVIDTEWQASQRLPGDYHLFVHMLDAAGKPLTQADRIPGGGAFPTTRWMATQRWAETALLKIPDDLPTGIYRVVVGWYRYPDLIRLPVANNPDGLVDLTTVEIQ